MKKRKPKSFVTGANRLRMVMLIARHPDGITRDKLLELIYAADPQGGPSDLNIIAVMVHAANKQLRPAGYEIRATSLGRGARYILRTTDADSVSEPAGNPNGRSVEGFEPARATLEH